MTTLMNERVAIGGGVAARNAGPIHEALHIWRQRGGGTAAERDRLMRLWVEADVARLDQHAGPRAPRRAGTPGPEGSVAKLISAELNKDIYELCVDLLGMTGTLYPTHYEMRRPERAGGIGGRHPPVLPAGPGQLHRRWDVGDHAQHPRRAGPRPPRRTPGRQGRALVRGAPQLSTGTLLRVRWSRRRRRRQGVRERRFDIERDGRTVPGLLWTPPDAAGPPSPRPHRSRCLGQQARGLRRRSRPSPGPPPRLRRRRPSTAPSTVTAGPPGAGPRPPLLRLRPALVVRPHHDRRHGGRLAGHPRRPPGRARIGAGPVGYWGLSMGTILGLPAGGRRTPYRRGRPRPHGAHRTHPVPHRRRRRPTSRCPVLFLMQWHDELFPRDKVVDLFDALGSADKRMHAHPGKHGEVPAEEFEASERFLALTSRAPEPSGPGTPDPGAADGSTRPARPPPGRPGPPG